MASIILAALFPVNIKGTGYGAETSMVSAILQYRKTSLKSAGVALHVVQVSMGPPPFDGGNTLLLRAYSDKDAASMGPPPFDGGNHPNEAHPKALDGASMGPPPFDGGNQQAICQAATGNTCFNGATAFRRWKPGTPLAMVNMPSKLQWGHRLSTVETPHKGVNPLFPGDASMGPPPFDGGNQSGINKRVDWETLQWGHRLSTVETSRHSISSRQHCNRFNGATAFRRWKRLTATT